MSLYDTLARIPGLAGWEAARIDNQQQDQNTLNQFQQVVGLQAAMQKQAQQKQAMERQAAYRQAIAALGPNATQDQLAQVGAQYTDDPDKLMDIQQKSLDRKAAAEDRAWQFMQTMDAKQAELDRKRADDARQARTDADRLRIDEFYKNESLRLQKARDAVNASIAQQGLDMRRFMQDQTAQRQLDQQTQGLGTALERANLPEADAVLREVENALSQAPDLASYLAGPGSLMPDMAVPEAIRAGRQAFQKLFNITLKNRSGAAVTIPEFERLKAEFATGVWKTPKQIKDGVEQARTIVSNHYKAVAAGFPPEALEAYNKNLRQFGGTPLLEPGAGGGPKKITSDAEYDALPSGTVFIGPDGKTRKKP